MKLRLPALVQVLILVGLLGISPFIFPNQLGAFAQFGNTISGFVFGLERRPLADVDVELMDDLQRTISRTRTDGSGRYFFNAVSSGNFVVRVRPFRSDYQEADQPVEIQNINLGGGGVRGSANEFRDFYLKLRRGISPMAAAAAVFAQEVPEEAKKLYAKAITDLEAKRDMEAFAALKSALEIFPKYHAALEKLGTEYLRLGSPEAYQAAEILLTIAVEVYPRGYRSWYGLAYARYSRKKYDEALIAVQKLNEINAGMPESALLFGRLLRQTHKYPEAEKQLIKAKELSNDTIPLVHWELALLYGNDMKRYSDAAKELKIFLKLQPQAKDAEAIKKLIVEFETKAAKT